MIVFCSYLHFTASASPGMSGILDTSCEVKGNKECEEAQTKPVQNAFKIRKPSSG